MEIKIYYEDTDCGGVVYYANYLKYMERGRTEFLAERGVSVKGLMDEGTIFVVTRAELDYKSSARYGDTIVMETSVTETTGATMLFSHVMKDRVTGRLIVEGRVRLACIDLSGRPKRLPSPMRDMSGK